MRNSILRSGLVFTLFAGSAFTARAQEGHEGWGFGGASAAPVSNGGGTIAGPNYNESGATINGFLLGKPINTLLVFSKPVCGGIGSLGKMGDMVTYSGVEVTFASGFKVVNVTSYTDGPITYPPAAPAKPTPNVTLTDTAIGPLNYGDNGSVDGFLLSGFTVTAPMPAPSVSSSVFVNIGKPSSALATALTSAITSISVTGTLEAPPQCSPANTPYELDASSLTINGTQYQIDGMGMGFFFGHRD